MSNDAIEKWLLSGKAACIGELRLRPKPRSDLAKSPLMIQRGQATAFWLWDDQGGEWILKKFHPGKTPDQRYLLAIGRLLPSHASLVAGTGRRLLTACDLHGKWGCHKSAELASWLAGTLLMPRVRGSSWFAIADEIRTGEITLSSTQRWLLCRELAETVRLLESRQEAHRDLSGGNVLIDLSRNGIALIDFDCLFHSSLLMPAATTSGTEGYIAQFVYEKGAPNPARTWCPMADRFALALLSAEFLALGLDSPCMGDGGLFNQAELNARRGPSIDHVRGRLRTQHPGVGRLLDRALGSDKFADCPSPCEWIALAKGEGVNPAPSLADLGSLSAGEFERILKRRARAVPAWPAPRLDDLPKIELALAT